MNAGCGKEAPYPAPSKAGDPLFFCLEHVRSYNAEWNIFDGMTEEEAVRFRRSALAGERETYRRERVAAERRARDSFGGAAEAPCVVYSAEQTRAMAVLELSPPLTRRALRARYLRLVKECHPDVAGAAENIRDAERIKEINAAYLILKAALPV